MKKTPLPSTEGGAHNVYAYSLWKCDKRRSRHLRSLFYYQSGLLELDEGCVMLSISRAPRTFVQGLFLEYVLLYRPR